MTHLMSNKNSLKVVVNNCLCMPGYVVSPESKLSVPSQSLRAPDEADVEVCDLPFSCVLRPVKQLSSEVVVGAQCGSAVLRGAHVFAPGIIASPKCKTQTHMALKSLKTFISCCVLIK